MEQAFLLGILNNITLLLALGFLYSLAVRRWDLATLKGQLIIGLLFALVSAIGMTYPQRYLPGFLFDGRTVLISLVGFFCGALPTLITVLAPAVLLAWQGGSGTGAVAAATVSTTFVAALIGVLFHQLRPRWPVLDQPLPLLGFGVVIHAAGMLCLLALPAEVGQRVFLENGLPTLLVFPLATMVYGRLIFELGERKQALDTLQDYRAFLAEILNTVADPVYVKDRQHRWVLLNDAYCSLVGRPRGQLLGKSDPDIHPRQEADVFWARDEEVFLTGKSSLHEEEILNRENKFRTVLTQKSRYIDRRGNQFIVGIVRDITEQKLAETALRENEERYRAMMQQSLDAILIVDIRSKRIVEVNDQSIRMLGYSREEYAAMSAYDLLDESSADSDRRTDRFLLEALSERLLRVRHKDGRFIEAERSAAMIHHRGKRSFMFVLRDLSAERKLQNLILKDVATAADVQKALTPTGFDDVLVSVQTVYTPYHMVSGDFYDYGWSKDHQRFSGFILDVSGHGVTSSLRGIAVSAYFREVMDSQMPLEGKLKWINQRVLRYFTDETYAAAIYFEFDFAQQMLRYVTAGIYRFLASSDSLPQVVFQAGSFIGISEKPEYFECKVPIRPGDAFYFMTDGIFDQLTGSEEFQVHDFEQTVHQLRDLAEAPTRRDDCSAICVRISGQPTFPIRLELHRFGELNRIRERIRSLLNSVARKEAGKIAIALGEALNNAARESNDMRVKLSLFGHRLVVRVKDGGPGFEGNSRIAEYSRSAPGSLFEERLTAEDGRGIMIMLSWMDRVIYSRKGNEVLMMKRLDAARDS